ncbi:hypothetical protein EON66_12120, partial [archaeon]
MPAHSLTLVRNCDATLARARCRYLSLQKRLGLLWLTLGKAAPELLAFCASMVMLLLGFAFLAHLSFGANLPEFYQFSTSIATLLRMSMGDFGYERLSSTRPALVGIFFVSYMVLMFLICLNVVIAILSKYYDIVHEELKTSDKWKLNVVTVDSQLLQHAMLFLRRRCTCCFRSCLIPTAM